MSNQDNDELEEQDTPNTAATMQIPYDQLVARHNKTLQGAKITAGSVLVWWWIGDVLLDPTRFAKRAGELQIPELRALFFRYEPGDKKRLQEAGQQAMSELAAQESLTAGQLFDKKAASTWSLRFTDLKGDGAVEMEIALAANWPPRFEETDATATETPSERAQKILNTANELLRKIVIGRDTEYLQQTVLEAVKLIGGDQVSTENGQPMDSVRLLVLAPEKMASLLALREFVLAAGDESAVASDVELLTDFSAVLVADDSRKPDTAVDPSTHAKFFGEIDEALSSIRTALALTDAPKRREARTEIWSDISALQKKQAKYVRQLQEAVDRINVGIEGVKMNWDALIAASGDADVEAATKAAEEDQD